jgi:Ca2+-binding EF-hand superfamily protein
MNIKTTVISSFAVLTLSAVAVAGSHGRALQKLDTDGDGKVTPTEMRQAATERHSAADADGDKAVTRAEMTAHMQAKRAEHRAKVFAKKDTNADGALSPDELSRMPDAVFQKLDVDNNGSLSAKEFSAARGPRHAGKHAARRGKEKREQSKAGERGGRHRGGPGQMFAKLDGNGDGKIDLSEATANADRRFKRLDENGDGVLSADELKHRRGHRGKGRKGGQRGQQRKGQQSAK